MAAPFIERYVLSRQRVAAVRLRPEAVAAPDAVLQWTPLEGRFRAERPGAEHPKRGGHH